MFQLNDDFLKELGLDSLPEQQKQAFLEHILEELQERVGMRLSEGLSDQQLSEFESFMDRDEAKTRAWIAAHASDYQNDPSFLQLRQSAQAQNAPEVAILAEYASLKWLTMNRPDYREVVRQTLDELKREIAGNRDAILGKTSSTDSTPS